MESNYKERLKYFRLVLSINDNSQDNDDKWTPVIDMKTFRESCLYGIPDEPGYRSTAWKVLLGYLPPDKRMWESTLKNQRLLYYNWVKDLLEEPGEEPPSRDHPLNAEQGSKWAAYFHDNTILEQIDKDVRRTLPDFAFFQLQVSKNNLNPLSPPTEEIIRLLPYEADPLSSITNEEMTADSVARRFSFGLMGRPRSGSNASKKSHNNNSNNNTRARSNSRSSVRSFSSGILDTGSEIIATPRNLVRKLSTAFTSKSASNLAHKLDNNKKPTLEPICPYIPTRRTLFKRIAHLNQDIGNREQTDQDDSTAMDYHWEVIERILFIYAKLNPGVGYVQGMNEILAPIYYVFAAKTADDDMESKAYAEADAFFVFTSLMSDVRDHFVRSLDHDSSTGINATMWRMSQRLAWFDRPLFRDLSKKDIKEQYYAFRWITVLCSQEWDLPDVIRLWDSILADRGMQESVDGGHFEFLLDFSVAMLTCIRNELIKGDFVENMRILQNYPLDDLQYVLNYAYSIRAARLQAIAQGKVIPGVNDKRSSGIFSNEFSDTSSISSAGSGSRFRKLKDTTDLARASLDSLKRGSKESLDELFKRNLSFNRNTREDIDKRSSIDEVKTRTLSHRFSFTNNLTSKLRRTSSVLSVNKAYSSQQEEQIHSDWLLANQLSALENNNVGHTRQNSIASNTSSRSSLMNRLSQIVANNKPQTHSKQSLEEQTSKNANSTYSSAVSNPLKENNEEFIGTYRGFI